MFQSLNVIAKVTRIAAVLQNLEPETVRLIGELIEEALQNRDPNGYLQARLRPVLQSSTKGIVRSYR